MRPPAIGPPRCLSALAVLAAVTATACSFDFADHTRMGVMEEYAEPGFSALAGASTVYIHELKYSGRNPGYTFAAFDRRVTDREWQDAISRWRDDFAQRVLYYWREQRMRPRIVFLTDGEPAPPGLAIRPVVHHASSQQGADWGYATLSIEDTETGTELYFARVELPAASGKWQARKLFSIQPWDFRSTIANAHLAFALPTLVRTGKLPRPGIGVHPRWPLGELSGLTNEARYWRMRGQATRDPAARARFEARSAQLKAVRPALVRRLSSACRLHGYGSAICYDSERQRAGLPGSAP